MPAWVSLLSAAITAGFAFLGVYTSNRKQTALIDYRLKQVEAKVGQHNNLEGRVIVLETKMKDLHAG